MRRFPRPLVREVIAAVAVLLSLVLVMFFIGRQAQQISLLRTQYDGLHADYESLYDEAVEAGASPEAPAPSSVPDPAPEPPRIVVGAQGERGFTGAQGPQGRTGPPGEIGPPGPLGPRGPAGADGLDGISGANGTDGQPGLPGTDGAPGADGADGADGKDGADGAPGRGIAKVECHTTGDWIFTFTDGTASTVTGPCRVTQPTPTPSASTTKGR
jgi:hypothetical protein